MKISSNSYPVARLPAAPVPRREDVPSGDAVTPARETPAVQRPTATTQTSLPSDMLQAALRRRSVDAGSSFSSQQALAEYANVVRQNESEGSSLVVGFDAYV